MARVSRDDVERWASLEGGSAPRGRLPGERRGSLPLLGELMDPGGEVAGWAGRKARERCPAGEASEAVTCGELPELGWAEGVASLESSLFGPCGGETGFKRQTSKSWSPPPRAHTGPILLGSGGTLARRRGFGAGLRLRMPAPMQGWREVLCARGYCVGGVIGLSRANFGFGVVLVNKGEQSFAAKGTNEGIQDGILNTTLQREYRVLRRLCHPGVVRAEAMIDAARGCAIVMQYCPGKQLTSLLPRHSGLPDNGRHSVLEGILDAVSYLHSQQVAHRDLHGHNVMVDCEESGAGSSAEVKAVRLVDFGSAQDLVVEGHRGVSELEDLTKEILPPEAALGLACPFGCDVFATGLLAAGLCAGREIATVDVTSEGVLAGTEELLKLSTAGQAHLRGMIALLPDDRPTALECYESLPPVAAWMASEANLGATALQCLQPEAEGGLAARRLRLHLLEGA